MYPDPSLTIVCLPPDTTYKEAEDQHSRYPNTTLCREDGQPPPPPPPQPATSCSKLANTDFQNSTTIADLGVKTDAECCAACKTEPDCTVGVNSTSGCYLKKAQFMTQTQACNATSCTALFPAGHPLPATGPPTVGPPNAYYPHFNTRPDYLNIGGRVNADLGSNYYMVIGDWGGEDGDTGHGPDQAKCAERMREYVTERKRRNPKSTLLFVLSVGDNFYWVGGGALRFEKTWHDVYSNKTDLTQSNELVEVPWFSVMGNHDYGDSDLHAICSWKATGAFKCPDNSTLPTCGYSSGAGTSQTYAGRQLDPEKHGDARPEGLAATGGYHMPDFTYYYSIPELSLEIVAIDQNIVDSGNLGGTGGAGQVEEFCGSMAEINSALGKLAAASSRLLQDRAKNTSAHNIAIINHYPGVGPDLRDDFIRTNQAGKAPGANVKSFYGHVHSQTCEKMEGSECVNYLTGGGGGCCGGNASRGFTVLTFQKNSAQQIEHVTECFAGQTSENGTCFYTQTASADPSLSCAFTNDAPWCHDGVSSWQVP